MPESIFRVTLIGSESTGKTTMAQALARELETEWVPEYGREYTEAKYGQGDYQWTDQDFVNIAVEQVRQEAEASKLANGVLIGDTDAFATCVWAERYQGHRIPEVEKIGAAHLPDLYLLTLVDFPFEADHIRDGEHLRDWMHKLFLARIEAAGVPYVTLGGPHETRLAHALEVIRRHLAES